VSVFFTCKIYLQFDSHRPVTIIAVEYRIRFEVVVVNGTGFLFADVAVVAPWLIVIHVHIVGIVLMDHPTAVLAGSVATVIAGLTKRRFAVTGIVIRPDPLTTPGTDHGVLPKTLGTKQCVIMLRQFLHGEHFAANSAAFKFHIIPSENKNSPRLITSGFIGIIYN
jgi:hypothetical protein